MKKTTTKTPTPWTSNPLKTSLRRKPSATTMETQTVLPPRWQAPSVQNTLYFTLTLKLSPVVS